MNLTWLSINCSYSHSSLALPILHLACSECAGIHWNFTTALTQDDPFSIACAIRSQAPDIVAASLYIFNRQTVLATLSRLKVLLPDIIILAGGPECLGEGADDLLDSNPFIDFVLSGEGEDILPELLTRLSKSPSPPARQVIRVRQPAPFVNAPSPVSSPFFQTDKPFVQIETSRGCPFGCQYCTSAETAVRYKDLKHVQEELAALHCRGIREVRLIDRTFNTPDSRAVSILQLFRTNFQDMRFHLEIHPQFLTQALREELRQAIPGQLHIEAGIQSLHNEVLQAVGRPPHAEQALEGLEFLVSCAPIFQTHCDLLAGLPRQTLAGLVEDLKRLVAVHPAEIQLEILKVLPGTMLKSRAESLGIRYSRETPYDVMETPEMPSDDILTARALSRMTDLFYNHPALASTFFTACTADSQFPETLLAELRTHTAMLDSQTPSLDARMRFLHQILSADAQQEQASFELDKAWLRQANTPGAPNAPATNAQLIPCLPENASIVCGDAKTALEKRGTRLWMTRCGSQQAIFAFNRAIAPNHAAAEWECNT